QQVHRGAYRLRIRGYPFRGLSRRPREACRRDSSPPVPSRRKPWMMRDLNLRLSLPLLLLGVLAACTSHSNYRQGEIASQLGHWDDAVLYYMKALDNDPANITYRADLLRAKIKASQEHFEKGKEYEKAGVVERALVEYQQAVQLDPTNQYAQAQLEHVHREYLAQKQGPGVETIEQMKQKARGARPQPPVL